MGVTWLQKDISTLITGRSFCETDVCSCVFFWYLGNYQMILALALHQWVFVVAHLCACMITQMVVLVWFRLSICGTYLRLPTFFFLNDFPSYIYISGKFPKSLYTLFFPGVQPSPFFGPAATDFWNWNVWQVWGTPGMPNAFLKLARYLGDGIARHRNDGFGE